MDWLDSGAGCRARLFLPGVSSPTHLNILYFDGKAKLRLIKFETAGECGNILGWHYDDATAPREIVGCPATCELARRTAASEPLATFQMLLPCAIKIPDP
jgi:hypothetical protein